MAPRDQRRCGSKPFQPAIGRDFGPVFEVEARTRSFLARLLGSAAAAALAVIGCWAVAGPIVGASITYYFGHRRKDTA